MHKKKIDKYTRYIITELLNNLYYLNYKIYLLY